MERYRPEAVKTYIATIMERHGVSSDKASITADVLVEADMRGIFFRAPSVLWHLMHHRHAIPNNMPAEFDAAGLLEHRHGKPWEIHYSRRGIRPYGHLGINRDPVN